jgi:hypothetical protein
VLAAGVLAGLVWITGAIGAEIHRLIAHEDGDQGDDGAGAGDAAGGK